MPEELAEALARIRRRPRQRAVRGRLIAMAVVAVFLAQAIADRLYGAAVVFGLIVLVLGLTFYRPRRRRPRGGRYFTQPAG